MLRRRDLFRILRVSSNTAEFANGKENNKLISNQLYLANKNILFSLVLDLLLLIKNKNLESYFLDC